MPVPVDGRNRKHGEQASLRAMANIHFQTQ